VNFFKRSEFTCRCGCGYDTVDYELAEVLDNLRSHFSTSVDSPITVNSGCRCIEYNEKVKIKENPDYIPYSSKSKHLIGKATDIVVEGIGPIEVYIYLANKYKGKYGIGYYETFIHIDVGSNKRRW